VQDAVDHFFNYTQNFVDTALIEILGMLLGNWMDQDSLFMENEMLNFKEAGRHKYAREALCFQADWYALLSPQEAYCQFWNRDFNTHGGECNNIPLDLMLEHCDNYLKEMILIKELIYPSILSRLQAWL
jgi:hypothetical protein